MLELRIPKIPGGPLSQDFMRALGQEFGCNAFIETGTASGQTAEAAASIFDLVYTVELSDNLFETARRRLAHLPNVQTVHMHSAEWMKRVNIGAGVKPLVWLDAHWSGDGYARGPENCPLLAELNALATNPGWQGKPPVILMDDMRYASPSTVPVYSNHPTSGFPSLAEIRAAVKAIDPAYEFVLYGDIGMAYLPHDGFDVSEEVRQYQRDRLGDQLASILILSHDGLDGLRLCLDSVRAYTRAPYEILVLDNLSFDGSLQYLREQPDVRLIESAVNLGCPSGRARLLPEAHGQYVVLLDSDTIVTPGWLERLERAAWSDSRIGLLGPRSNWVSGPQIVPDVTYRDIPGLLSFAERWQTDHAGQLTATQRLVGFCLFIRRAVIDRIGNIDASFGRFGYEDDDLCRRAILAGFGVAIANEVYVHHTGGPQAKGDPEYNRLMAEAKAVFTTKWQDHPNTFDRARDYIPLVSPTPATSERPPAGVLVFSKDRACQLDLCLSSLTQHLTDGLPPIVVLYTTSDNRHQRQYGTLIEQWPGVTFRNDQGNFQAHVQDILADWEHVCFVTDDTIFTSGFSLSEAVAAIIEHKALGFSLRLGANITKGGPPENEAFRMPNATISDGKARWHWSDVGEARGFGYPLELSSSIYPTATILPIVRNHSIANPNHLEATLHAARMAYADRLMLCFVDAVAFSAVWNAVQAGNGWAQGMTATEFADAFDAGRRLDWRAYDRFETDAYHTTPDVRWREEK